MAKEPKQEQNPAPVQEEDAEVVKQPKSYRLHIIIGIACLLLFQSVILWLLLPARVVIQPNVGINPVEGVSGYETPNVVPPDIVSKKPVVEKPINEGKPFKVNNIRADQDMTESFTIQIDVRIFKADERKFDKQYKDRTAAIISRITEILRATTTEERLEAESTAIKEKVKRGINEVLGDPWVQQVLCSKVEIDQH